MVRHTKKYRHQGDDEVRRQELVLSDYATKHKVEFGKVGDDWC